MAAPSPRPGLQPQQTASVDAWIVKAVLAELLTHLLRSGTVTPGGMTEIFQRASSLVDTAGKFGINQLRDLIEWNVQHGEARPDA